MRTSRNISLLLCAAVLGGSLSACGSSTPKGGIVATNSVLAAIVQEVVGDSAVVETVIPDGKDPHDYQPSAGDIARLANARVIVANGYGYEPALLKSIASARTNGATVFDVEWNFSATGDPHWFTDPLRAADVMSRLVPVIEKALGVDLDSRSAVATAEFQSIVEDGRARLGALAGEHCAYAVEHVLLAPFGDRFECRGTTVLNMGSRVPDAEPSAADIERFAGDITDRGIKVLLEDASEKSPVLARVAESTGAVLVQAHVHGMGDAHSYREYILAIIDTLKAALS